jgi:hypothetical protein
MNIISCEDYTPTSQSTTGIFVYSDSQIHVKTDISCLPVYTWHVHPATQDMFVQSCMTCLTSHTWRVRSVMHDSTDGVQTFDLPGRSRRRWRRRSMGWQGRLHTQTWTDWKSLSHKRPLMHDNMICCQFSPVAHLHMRQSTDYWTQAIPTCSKLKETVIIYTLFWFYIHIHSKRCHFVIPGWQRHRVTILTAAKCWMCDIG